MLFVFDIYVVLGLHSRGPQCVQSRLSSAVYFTTSYTCVWARRVRLRAFVRVWCVVSSRVFEREEDF